MSTYLALRTRYEFMLFCLTSSSSPFPIRVRDPCKRRLHAFQRPPSIAGPALFAQPLKMFFPTLHVAAHQMPSPWNHSQDGPAQVLELKSSGILSA